MKGKKIRISVCLGNAHFQSDRNDPNAEMPNFKRYLCYHLETKTAPFIGKNRPIVLTKPPPPPMLSKNVGGKFKCKMQNADANCKCKMLT